MVNWFLWSFCRLFNSFRKLAELFCILFCLVIIFLVFTCIFLRLIYTFLIPLKLTWTFLALIFVTLRRSATYLDLPGTYFSYLESIDFSATTWNFMAFAWISLHLDFYSAYFCYLDSFKLFCNLPGLFWQLFLLL
jgi:hypothetical protein